MLARSARPARSARAPRLLGWLAVVALAALLAGCGFGASGSSGSPGVTVQVKVVSQHGATLVLLPVTINGHGPYTFALDTGASTSLIDKPLAHQLGLQQTGPSSQIAGVASDEQAFPVAVQNWHIEQLRLPKLTVAAANLFASQHGQGLQGLIGSDVWNRFGTITLSYSNQQLTVPRQIAAATSRAPAPPTLAARGPHLAWRQPNAA